MSYVNGQFIYAAKDQSKYGLANSVQANAQAVMKGTSNTGFGQGFKVGYTGVTMFFHPFLEFQAAKNEKRLMKMQGELAKLQSKVLHTAADDVMRGGERQGAAVGYEAGQNKARSRVLQAAAGIQVGASGSAAETLSDIDIIKEIQVNQIAANAVAESFGYRKQGVMESNKAEAYFSSASSISPWAAALTAMAQDAMNMMDSGMGGQGGGGGGGGGGNGMASWQDFGAFFKNFKGFGGK